MLMRRRQRGLGGRRVGRRRQLGWRVAAVKRVLRHVTGQVGLLRVGLTADVADVRLEVLRLRVLGDVLPEALLVGEALVARVAAERLVCHVRAAMRLQVGQLGECLATSRVLALIRPLARVCPVQWRTRRGSHHDRLCNYALDTGQFRLFFVYFF